MTKSLSGIHNSGVKMMDVSKKRATKRVARASSWIQMKPSTLRRIREGRIEKGDVLSVARVAGILAAKRTPEWVPLCHPISLSGIDLAFQEESPENGKALCRLRIAATVRTVERTGVEMEALSAVSAAALSIYDMCKSVDRGMEIGGVRLDLKTGGRSGTYRRQKTKRKKTNAVG